MGLICAIYIFSIWLHFLLLHSSSSKIFSSDDEGHLTCSAAAIVNQSARKSHLIGSSVSLGAAESICQRLNTRYVEDVMRRMDKAQHSDRIVIDTTCAASAGQGSFSLSSRFDLEFKSSIFKTGSATLKNYKILGKRQRLQVGFFSAVEMDMGKVTLDLEPGKKLVVPVQSYSHFELLTSEHEEGRTSSERRVIMRKVDGLCSYLNAKDSDPTQPGKLWMALSRQVWVTTTCKQTNSEAQFGAPSFDVTIMKYEESTASNPDTFTHERMSPQELVPDDASHLFSFKLASDAKENPAALLTLSANPKFAELESVPNDRMYYAKDECEKLSWGGGYEVKVEEGIVQLSCFPQQFGKQQRDEFGRPTFKIGAYWRRSSGGRAAFMWKQDNAYVLGQSVPTDTRFIEINLGLPKRTKDESELPCENLTFFVVWGERVGQLSGQIPRSENATDCKDITGAKGEAFL
eukprot:TRINITY_DN22830_c0_g1_i1.p1 TRINITY_DN22830_c0_g1~~TRINITY_DN22830_c0_g1_i1.p1  ORF type:complete len:461 (+),score=30.80 TRINITY_DN22830_c0_g1_i1:46-1428(+)